MHKQAMFSVSEWLLLVMLASTLMAADEDRVLFDFSAP